jgi:hypothetical protein
LNSWRLEGATPSDLSAFRCLTPQSCLKIKRFEFLQNFLLIQEGIS